MKVCKKVLSIFMCLLMAFSLMGEIHAEVATNYTLNTTVSGTLEGEDDIYRLTLTKPAQISIYLKSMNASSDLTIETLNGDYIYYEDTDYDNNVNCGTLNDKQILLAGTYYVKVSSDSNAQYSMKLQATYLNCTFPSVSTFEKPHIIALGKTINGVAYQSKDFYSFVAPATGNYKIQLRSGVDEYYDFFLYDANRNQLKEDFVYETSATYTYKFTGGKRYYILIKSDYKAVKYLIKVCLPADSVSLNTTSKSFYTDQKYQLKASISPSKATYNTVKWTSSNTKVATVDSKGLVYTKTPGTAYIKATTPEGKTKSAKITVLKRGLTTTSKSLYVKASTTLSFKGSYGAITWSSSNKSIATVDKNGKVTAHKAGSVYITAKSGKAVSKCKITVKKPALSATKKSLRLGSHATLKVTGGNGKITWSTSNKKIATVNSKGYITTKKAGTVYITAKRNGYPIKCKLTVLKPVMATSKKTLYTGFGATLKVTGGTGKITWSSSNKKIATVNSKGYVSAKKSGTVYISAKRNGYTTKCKVTVKANTKTFNISTNVSSYSYGQPHVVAKKIYYSNGQLMLDTYVMNNTPYKVNKLNQLYMKIYDYQGNVIASQTFKNRTLNVNPYGSKKITFKFSKGATKMKKALLYKGFNGYVNGTYTYNYY